MTSINVDRHDLELLTELQRDGRTTNAALGEKIHLSTSQVSRRVQRLEEAGVIDHYAALIDPAVVGLGVMAFTHVVLERHGSTLADKGDTHGARFEREIADLPEVLECFSVAGEADYVLRIVAYDLAALSEFMTKHLLRLPGVSTVKSTISLQKIKQTNVLPLKHIIQPRQTRQRIRFASD